MYSCWRSVQCCVHVSILSDVTHHKDELLVASCSYVLVGKNPKIHFNQTRNIVNFVKGRWELKLSEQRPPMEFHLRF